MPAWGQTAGWRSTRPRSPRPSRETSGGSFWPRKSASRFRGQPRPPASERALKPCCAPSLCARSGWRVVHLIEAAEHLPVAVRSVIGLAAAASSAPATLRPDRRRREYLNGVLARNEVSRDYAYNHRLSVRDRAWALRTQPEDRAPDGRRF